MFRAIINLIKSLFYLPFIFWNYLSRPSKVILSLAVIIASGFLCFSAFNNNPGTNSNGILVSGSRQNQTKNKTDSSETKKVLGEQNTGNADNAGETPASPVGRQNFASLRNAEIQSQIQACNNCITSKNIAYHSIEAKDIDGNSITGQ